jgi:hypothetical protein
MKAVSSSKKLIKIQQQSLGFPETLTTNIGILLSNSYVIQKLLRYWARRGHSTSNQQRKETFPIPSSPPLHY